MANPEVTRRGSGAAPGACVLRPGTLASAAVAVCLAQVALAIPAVLNGMFTTDLGPTSSQLTWITDAFLVPVCLLELTFGVLGSPGRPRGPADDRPRGGGREIIQGNDRRVPAGRNGSRCP